MPRKYTYDCYTKVPGKPPRRKRVKAGNNALAVRQAHEYSMARLRGARQQATRQQAEQRDAVLPPDPPAPRPAPVARPPPQSARLAEDPAIPSDTENDIFNIGDVFDGPSDEGEFFSAEEGEEAAIPPEPVDDRALRREQRERKRLLKEQRRNERIERDRALGDLAEEDDGAALPPEKPLFGMWNPVTGKMARPEEDVYKCKGKNYCPPKHFKCYKGQCIPKLPLGKQMTGNDNITNAELAEMWWTTEDGKALYESLEFE